MKIFAKGPWTLALALCLCLLGATRAAAQTVTTGSLGGRRD